jgi:hypothetical protein
LRLTLISGAVQTGCADFVAHLVTLALGTSLKKENGPAAGMDICAA